MANCSRKKSLHHLFQVINNNVFKTTFPLDHHHHHCHFECHDRDYTKFLTIMRNSSVKLLLPLLLLQSNIILHNLDLRLNHAISIIHKIWLLPKSLHICICHRRRGKDCHHHLLLRRCWEKENQEFTHEKMRKNNFQNVNSWKSNFFGELNFIMPNFITQFLRCPKMGNKDLALLPIHFVIHDYALTHGQWFLKVPFYLFDQSGKRS